MRYLVDDKGRSVVQEMINLVRAEGEGFYEYEWTKPGASGTDHRKIAYLKLIPELGWLLGAGEYLEDVENDQRTRTLEFLSNLVVEENGYLFGGTLDGVSLLGPAKGQNMLDIQDVNGVFIVRELIEAARSGGGFVEYVLPPFPDKAPLPKISYAKEVPEWGWYIGYGVYLEELEDQIARMRTDIYRRVAFRLVYIGVIISLLCALLVLISRHLARRFKSDYSVFMDYFEHAALRSEPIEIELLGLYEYRYIAAALNTMIERKRDLDTALQNSLDERAALLREVHHRVKNNFQTVASLLSIQRDQSTRPEIRDALLVAHDRIHSMAAVHNLLYHNDVFSRINIRDYVGEIVSNVSRSHSSEGCAIEVCLEIEDLELSLEKAIPLGLILNELLTNSWRHAFAGRQEGSISIRARQEDAVCHFFYADSGSGLESASAGCTDEQREHGLGLTLIETLASQLEGTLLLDSDCSCSLSFPL